VAAHGVVPVHPTCSPDPSLSRGARPPPRGDGSGWLGLGVSARAAPCRRGPGDHAGIPSSSHASACLGTPLEWWVSLLAGALAIGCARSPECPPCRGAAACASPRRAASADLSARCWHPAGHRHHGRSEPHVTAPALGSVFFVCNESTLLDQQLLRAHRTAPLMSGAHSGRPQIGA